MRHASLFTGIGGFDLAANWMGWQNVFQVEIDPWCQQLLAKRFPTTSKHTDIKAFDGTQYHGAVDIISGGFPCQPYSAAGKRLGKNDDRHLWPEMLRIIHEVQPSWVVGENVRGLTNWNGGLVFDEVQADLELAGYQVLPFLLPACGVNAPHRRDRIWFVAHSTSQQDFGERQERLYPFTTWTAVKGPFANTNHKGLQGSKKQRGLSPKRSQWQEQSARHLCGKWQDFPTQSPICRRDDGISNRVDRLRGLGNAIVPQVALQIFKAIHEYANL